MLDFIAHLRREARDDRQHIPDLEQQVTGPCSTRRDRAHLTLHSPHVSEVATRWHHCDHSRIRQRMLRVTVPQHVLEPSKGIFS
jgi:hypothetical protein